MDTATSRSRALRAVIVESPNLVPRYFVGNDPHTQATYGISRLQAPTSYGQNCYL